MRVHHTNPVGGHFDNDVERNRAYSSTDGEEDSGYVSSSSTAKRVGGVFSFEDTEVVSRVGISWISKKKACQHVEDEIPAETSFESVVDDAESEWEETVFSKVTTTSTNETNLELLYSSLYFMHLIPTNQTGENPGWESDEPYYQDIFTFWVSIRHQSQGCILNENRTHSAAQRHSCTSCNPLRMKSRYAL